MDHRRTIGALALFLVVLLASAGCRSSREVVEPAPEITIREDFDPTAYPDPPPVLVGDIVHEVPAQLTGGSAPSARSNVTPRVLAGYRIQVGSSRDRNEANQFLQETIEWWNMTREEEDPSIAPIYIEWEQPYWKVRLGNFRTRQEANRMLSGVRQEFEGAFVVPSPIEVR